VILILVYTSYTTTHKCILITDVVGNEYKNTTAFVMFVAMGQSNLSLSDVTIDYIVNNKSCYVNTSVYILHYHT